MDARIDKVVTSGKVTVDDTDYDNDGGCTLTISAGQGAEKRAREYFEWLQSRVVRPSAVDAGP